MRENPKWVLMQPYEFEAGETTAENVLCSNATVGSRGLESLDAVEDDRITAKHGESRDEERSLDAFRMGHGSTVVPGPFSWFLGHRLLGGKLRRRSEAG